MKKIQKNFYKVKYLKKDILKLIKYIEKEECMWYYYKHQVFQVDLDSDILILDTSKLGAQIFFVKVNTDISC